VGVGETEECDKKQAKAAEEDEVEERTGLHLDRQHRPGLRDGAEQGQTVRQDKEADRAREDHLHLHRQEQTGSHGRQGQADGREGHRRVAPGTPPAPPDREDCRPGLLHHGEGRLPRERAAAGPGALRQGQAAGLHFQDIRVADLQLRQERGDSGEDQRVPDCAAGQSQVMVVCLRVGNPCSDQAGEMVAGF